MAKIPSQNWGVHNEWPTKKQAQKSITEQNVRGLLENKSLQEIRDWAKSQGLKSKDNSKKDLIGELIKELEEQKIK